MTQQSFIGLFFINNKKRDEVNACIYVDKRAKNTSHARDKKHNGKQIRYAFLHVGHKKTPVT